MESRSANSGHVPGEVRCDEEDPVRVPQAMDAGHGQHHTTEKPGSHGQRALCAGRGPFVAVREKGVEIDSSQCCHENPTTTANSAVIVATNTWFVHYTSGEDGQPRGAGAYAHMANCAI